MVDGREHDTVRIWTLTYHLLQAGFDGTEDHTPCDLAVTHDRFHIQDHSGHLGKRVPDTIARWTFDLDQEVAFDFA